MNIVVKIQGREAIPIRAIPLLTDWEVLSPDVCAKAFAGDEISAQHFENMSTYRLDKGGSYTAISSRWWANWVVRELDECAERTQAAGISDEIGYALWRSESIELLPAGTFVWRDEFENAYQAEYGPESMRVVCSKEAYEADIYDLNFNPSYGPRDDWQAIVMEGFEQLFTERDGGEKLRDDEKKRRLNSERSETAVGLYIENSPWTPVGASVKRWTPEFVAEVTAYRAIHGLKKTAEYFKVSQTTISRHVPSEKKRRQASSTFNWGVSAPSLRRGKSK